MLTLQLSEIGLVALICGIATTVAVFRHSKLPELSGGIPRNGDLGKAIQAGAAVTASIALLLGVTGTTEKKEKESFPIVRTVEKVSYSFANA